MPCDTISVVKLNMGALNVVTMKATLEALGHKVVNEYNGILSGSWGEVDCNRGTVRSRYVDEVTLKRSYTGEVVKAQAKRFGWQTKQVSQYEYELYKR